jgi:hypothetical protein
VDETLAERRFVAYAWPASIHNQQTDAFFIDEYEQILQAPNVEVIAGYRKFRLIGSESPPSCDDALAEPTRSHWSVWRGKKPRTTLPGLPKTP